jgi:thiamine biosynthesis protein ThiI
MGFVHVRYDEIGLKGGNRPHFEKKLRKNLSRQLKLENGGSVRRTRGRIVVDTGTRDPRATAQDAVRCFGVAGASPVLIVEKELDKIFAAAIDLAREGVAAGKKTFRVEARRADKTFPIQSTELAGKVGHAVLEALPGALKVNLHEPELTIGLEVRKEGAALHALALQGPGGIPVGIAGRALVLLSGGIDSPVAAWMTLKRGLHTDFIYFHSFPYTGDKAKEKVLTLGRELSRWAPDPIFGFIPSFTAIQDAIAAVGDEEIRTVVLRRFMYRVAARVARLRRHKALVTGEALGQVASQTPENLLCVQVCVPDLLVLRPLTGFDKNEVVVRAKNIGTFETSILPYEDCCSIFAPRHPATKATPERCLELESKLDVAALETEALAGAEVWRLSRGNAPTKLEGGIRPFEDRQPRPKKAKPETAAEPEHEDEPRFPERAPSSRASTSQGSTSQSSTSGDDVLTTDFSEG